MTWISSVPIIFNFKGHQRKQLYFFHNQQSPRMSNLMSQDGGAWKLYELTNETPFPTANHWFLTGFSVDVERADGQPTIQLFCLGEGNGGLHQLYERHYYSANSANYGWTDWSPIGNQIPLCKVNGMAVSDNGIQDIDAFYSTTNPDTGITTNYILTCRKGTWASTWQQIS